MMKSPIEDFFKILWIPIDVMIERHFNTFHKYPHADVTKNSIVCRSSGVGGSAKYMRANKLLALNNVKTYKPLI